MKEVIISVISSEDFVESIIDKYSINVVDIDANDLGIRRDIEIPKETAAVIIDPYIGQHQEQFSIKTIQNIKEISWLKKRFVNYLIPRMARNNIKMVFKDMSKHSFNKIPIIVNQEIITHLLERKIKCEKLEVLFGFSGFDVAEEMSKRVVLIDFPNNFIELFRLLRNIKFIKEFK